MLPKSTQTIPTQGTRTRIEGSVGSGYLFKPATSMFKLERREKDVEDIALAQVIVRKSYAVLLMPIIYRVNPPSKKAGTKQVLYVEAIVRRRNEKPIPSISSSKLTHRLVFSPIRPSIPFKSIPYRLKPATIIHLTTTHQTLLPILDTACHYYQLESSGNWGILYSQLSTASA